MNETTSLYLLPIAASLSAAAPIIPFGADENAPWALAWARLKRSDGKTRGTWK